MMVVMDPARVLAMGARDGARPSPQSNNYNLESNLINHKFTELKIHVSRSMAQQLCCADTWCHICMAHRLDCGDTRDVNGTYSIQTSKEANYSAR